MAWTDNIRQASFRTVPFGVTDVSGNFGRRTAVHEYPFRDIPWVEDMGRATRGIVVRGFLIENSKIYGGGSVILQREKLIAAVEKPGPGILIHPTLGRLNVSCRNLAVNERADLGRVFEIALTIVEAGERVFPNAAPATGELVGSAADAADAAASEDFVSVAIGALEKGAAVVQQAVRTTQSYTAIGERLVSDATTAFHLVTNLPGSFGRYFSGRNVGGLSGVNNLLYGTDISVGSLIQSGTASRSSVAEASAALQSITGDLGL